MEQPAVYLSHSLTFLKGYFQNPRAVGSLLPSSRSLAAAICRPYLSAEGRSTVLEVGAGTGPITRYFGSILRPGDEFDVCEMNEDFADVLEEHVLSHEVFAPAVAQGRVRLLRIAAQKLHPERKYDFVICGLPFTSLKLADVRQILSVIRACMKPGAVFSYYEYAWLRRLARNLALIDRKRIREVSDYMTDHIARYQFERHTIWKNLPPAHVRHLRFFDGTENVAPTCRQ